MTATFSAHPELARKMWRTLEPYHGIIYFTPHAVSEYQKLGIHGRDGYFASRAAALGPASAELVISTFYNFHPSLVHHAIPAAWETASPESILDARLRAADAAIRDCIGDEFAGDEMVEAASLAERAARRADVIGRPLFAAHASLPWPTAPHLVLWHAITLLREFRGDGHIAALVVSGLDGCEALVTHGSAEADGVSEEVLQRSRAWPDAEWQAAKDRLASRGLYEAGGPSPAGVALRAAVEEMTDRAAGDPWNALSGEEAQRLRSLVRPWSRAIVASGTFGLR